MKFHDVLDAIKDDKKVKHDGWYDGQFISWHDPAKHFLLSKEKLLSDKWEIEGETETPASEEKSKSYSKKK